MKANKMIQVFFNIAQKSVVTKVKLIYEAN